MSENLVPEIGMGATEYLYSDRHAVTVTAVSASGKKLTVQRDKAVRVNGRGMSDAQEWDITRDENGTTRDYSLRKNGKWIAVGMPANDGVVLGLGHRREYYDFSF